MTQPDAPAAPPRPRGRTRALIGLCLIAALATFWYRGRTHADVLTVQAHAGRAGGVMSLHGQLFLGLSNIDMGRPWVAFTQSVTIEDGARVRDYLLDTPDLSQHWGFVAATHKDNAFELPGRWCIALAAPHWALVPPALLLIYPWVAARLRLRRRRRKGWCLTCGYDLQGAPTARCPECGTAPLATPQPTHAGA